MVNMTNNSEPTYDYGPEYAQDTVTDVSSPGTLAVLNASEIDRQISTAKHYPRSMKDFRDIARDLVTQDEQAAAECIYALPRDGKTIDGPTSRFAEIIAYAWTNCRCGARVVDENEEFVTAQGMFFDVQQNVAYSYEVKRRITDKKGRKYSPDMVVVTANAACSIALRNAVLKGIPKAIWKGLYAAAKQTIAGKRETLVTRRQETINLFKAYNVTADMVYRVLGVKGIADISSDHVITMNGMLTALAEGDSTVEQMFAEPSTEDQGVAKKAKESIEGIKAKYRKPVAQIIEKPVAQPAQKSQSSIPTEIVDIPPEAPVEENLDAEPPPEKPKSQLRQIVEQAQANLEQKRKTTTKTKLGAAAEIVEGIGLKMDDF
jgi:hypothetical protein